MQERLCNFAVRNKKMRNSFSNNNDALLDKPSEDFGVEINLNQNSDEEPSFVTPPNSLFGSDIVRPTQPPENSSSLQTLYGSELVTGNRNYNNCFADALSEQVGDINLKAFGEKLSSKLTDSNENKQDHEDFSESEPSSDNEIEAEEEKDIESENTSEIASQVGTDQELTYYKVTANSEENNVIIERFVALKKGDDSSVHYLVSKRTGAGACDGEPYGGCAARFDEDISVLSHVMDKELGNWLIEEESKSEEVNQLKVNFAFYYRKEKNQLNPKLVDIHNFSKKLNTGAKLDEIVLVKQDQPPKQENFLKVERNTLPSVDLDENKIEINSELRSRKVAYAAPALLLTSSIVSFVLTNTVQINAAFASWMIVKAGSFALFGASIACPIAGAVFAGVAIAAFIGIAYYRSYKNEQGSLANWMANHLFCDKAGVDKGNQQPSMFFN